VLRKMHGGPLDRPARCNPESGFEAGADAEAVRRRREQVEIVRSAAVAVRDLT
jgi:hypothetical protein